MTDSEPKSKGHKYQIRPAMGKHLKKDQGYRSVRKKITSHFFGHD